MVPSPYRQASSAFSAAFRARRSSRSVISSCSGDCVPSIWARMRPIRACKPTRGPVDRVIGGAVADGELVQPGQGGLGQAEPGHGLLVAGAVRAGYPGQPDQRYEGESLQRGQRRPVGSSGLAPPSP
jgi:hypothetical protein